METVADGGPAVAEFSLLIDVWIHYSKCPERDLYNVPEMFALARPSAFSSDLGSIFCRNVLVRSAPPLR